MVDDENERAFHIVVRGLASQGWQRSFDRGGEPRLRGPKGRKCPIGWLISDKRYTRGMEDFTEDWPPLPGSTKLRELMRQAHDQSFSPRDMCKSYELIRDFYGLTWPADVRGRPSPDQVFDV